MSETKSISSNHSNSRKFSIPSVSTTAVQRKTSFMSVTSDVSQVSSEIHDPNNTPKACKFALWGRRVGKMVGVRRKLSYTSRVPEIVDENENTEEDNFIQKIDENDLPIHPRFPATMSKEAQYSYLKGYEDLILNQLEHSKLPRIYQGSLSQRPITKLEKNQSIKLEPKILIKNDHFIPHTTNNKIESHYLPTIHQQLCTSYRLQNALDIFDYLKNGNGNATFSKRFEKHITNPSKHFNDWKHVWIQDFEIESKCH